jgi:hypothetical protein
MVTRLLTSLALATFALTILAWPLSRPGLTYSQTRGRLTTNIAITDGSLIAATQTLPPRGVIDRDQFHLSFARTVPPASLRPRFVRTPSSTTLTIPLIWPLAISGATAAVLIAWPWHRLRRRRRRGLCLHCGYQRSPGDAPCPECGRTPADGAHRPPSLIASRISDAGPLLFLMLLLLSGGAWFTHHREQRSIAVQRAHAADFSWYLKVCQPRLTGAVAVARPGDLPGVVARSKPGTIIVLLPGQHTLPTSTNARLNDVWLLGSGRDTTTLSLQVESARALRIENLTINCQDDPFFSVRENGSLFLRNCRIHNFNSGSGGSNAIYASDSALLVDACEFDGSDGRSAGRVFGNAFDLRGTTFLFVRDTTFNNLQEIVRNTVGVLDHVQVTNTDPRMFFPPRSSEILMRDVSIPRGASGALGGTPFTQALDDPAALTILASNDPSTRAAFTDPISRALADALRLDRDPGLWPRLLLHPSPEIRSLAATKAALLPLQSSSMTLDAALAQLAKPALTKEVVLTILASGPLAREQLQSRATGEHPQEQARAAALLQLMDAQPGIPELLQAEPLRPTP